MKEDCVEEEGKHERERALWELRCSWFQKVPSQLWPWQASEVLDVLSAEQSRGFSGRSLGQKRFAMRYARDLSLAFKGWRAGSGLMLAASFAIPAYFALMLFVLEAFPETRDRVSILAPMALGCFAFLSWVGRRLLGFETKAMLLLSISRQLADALSRASEGEKLSERESLDFEAMVPQPIAHARAAGGRL